MASKLSTISVQFDSTTKLSSAGIPLPNELLSYNLEVKQIYQLDKFYFSHRLQKLKSSSLFFQHQRKVIKQIRFD